MSPRVSYAKKWSRKRHLTTPSLTISSAPVAGTDIDAKGEGKVGKELFEDGAPEEARIIHRKRSGTVCAMAQHI